MVKQNKPNIQRFEKHSEEMIRDAFLKHPIKEDFEAVALNYEGKRTLALIFKKNAKEEN
jgi:hypothetical protein